MAQGCQEPIVEKPCRNQANMEGHRLRRGETIFNVKGNSYRLFALVNYEVQTIIITRVMTHAEYSKR